MTSIHLNAQSEKRAPDNPCGLDPWPLYHQMRTLEALRSYDLVMNTYNTGTGKTVASLLYLFALNRKNKNVLFIAPTNALLAQHAEDIDAFVRKNDLYFTVKRVTAADIRAIESGLRPGETLQRLIRNYLEFEPEAVERKPLILVVNPDIFYYALYFRYGAHDQRNVFERFLTAFDYIVIDEFHYYDYKQLANFLFAFALFDEFGYFAVRDRKVCLLSATPATAVTEYLDQLFEKRWTRLGPDNEPPESDEFETIPALTPMTLEIVSGSLTEWIDGNYRQVVNWVSHGDQDGAVISSSLAQINTAYASLRPFMIEEQMGRITGPEPEAVRVEATARDLILATPTVDIGYNFVKQGKDRQNVDFLICDARYGDELLQRIGRAGRVLGKEKTGIDSRGVAIVSDETAAELASYDGQTMSRETFAQIIRMCESLPPKHTLTGYIRSHAIAECFWPIFQLGKMMPTELETEMESLFERVHDLFAPSGKQSRKGLQWFFRKFEARERWLTQLRHGSVPFDMKTAEQVADWLKWLDPNQRRFEPHALRPHLDTLLAGEAQRSGLLTFVNSQVAATRALFSFRDSYQGPTATIFDPGQIFSSQTINRYDLFHLVRNYHLSPPMDRKQFEKICERVEEPAEFYFQLLGRRENVLVMEFVYESEDDREEFETKWCGRPVALNGVRLQMREKSGDAVVGALDHSIATALIEQYLPMLIVPPEDVGPMVARLRGSSLWSQRLTLYFPDGTLDERYRVLLGTAAFHAHAELRGHFLLKDRLKPDAIIL